MVEQQDNEIISLKSIIIDYLHYWKLFLGTFCVAIILAVLYLVFYPKTYEMMARVKVQDNTGMPSGNIALGDAAGLMKSFGLNGATSTGILIDDERAIFDSHSVWCEVVEMLGLNSEYVKPYTWNYKIYEDLPFIMVADSLTLKTQEEAVEFYIKEDETGKFHITGETSGDKKDYLVESLPAVIKFEKNTFVLRQGPAYEFGKSKKFYITMRPVGSVAEDLIKGINIDTYSDNSNVIEYTLQDYEKRRGIDILNAMIQVYNNRADSIKNTDASKTIVFLDERINKVIVELSEAERAIEMFKRNNKMTDLEYDIQFYVDQMKDLQTKIVELEAQGHAIKFMESFVQDPSNKYKLVPVLMSVQDGEKGSSISTYNALLVERQRLLQNSKEDNPLFSIMDKQLDEMRKSVGLSIKNAQESLNLTLKDLKTKEEAILTKMSDVPTQERNFLNYKRDQEIAQGVYLILLQKREELMLQMGKNLERAQIVDAGYAKSKPVAPRKLYAAIAIVLLTLIVPVVYLFCRDRFLELKEEYYKTFDK